MKTLLVAINAKFIHSNLAIRYLKAYSDKHITADIETIEFTINNYTDEILATIFEKQPDVIGFSCYIWNIEMVKKIVSLIKIVLPNVKIFLGGPEVSYNYEEVFASCETDFIISGEGEHSFTQLISSLQTAAPKLSEIEGLSYKTNEVIISNPRKTALDLSVLPFPYENFDGLENRIIYYEASRGCPFSCQYCLSSIEKGVRLAPLEKVCTELQIFIDRKVKQVKFVDRTFNCNKKFAMGIISFLINSDNGITNFHFEVAADLLDDEIMALLATARNGLFQLEIGVQSTNLNTLNAIQRKTNSEWISYCVKKLKEKNNMHIHLDLIAGLPLEDLESFKKSLNDVHALEPHQLQLGFLKVLKGSGMENLCSKYGILSSPYPPYEVLKTACLPYNDVLTLKGVEEMVEIYYNTNCFRNSSNYLKNNFSTPFDFYNALSTYKKQKGVISLVNNKQYSYAFLIEFAENLNINLEKLRWLIKFDMLLHENLRTTPVWLPLPTIENHDKIYTFLTKNPSIREFLPDYNDIDLKQLPKLVHIEEFPFNPKTLKDTPTTLLFNYRQTDVWGAALTQEVSL